MRRRRSGIGLRRRMRAGKRAGKRNDRRRRVPDLIRDLLPALALHAPAQRKRAIIAIATIPAPQASEIGSRSANSTGSSSKRPLWASIAARLIQ